MESKLIIMRGNSGSGKTTTVKSLQNYLGRGTLLVSQRQNPYKHIECGLD